MSVWHDARLIDRLGVEHPLWLAPMAGAGGVDLAVAVARAGGVPSLPCASITTAQALEQIEAVRRETSAPINLNFFAHEAVEPDAAAVRAWRERLAPYERELGVGPATSAGGGRAPFDDAMCRLVEASRPAIVSFHFGLPAPPLLQRVKAIGAFVVSSATTVEEARWLEARGVDAIIAQGYEAGGHRATFLDGSMSTQPGLFALLPQVVDAVHVPVIAAGGIADGRGMAAALSLGAAAVQLGTAFLRSPQSLVAPLHRQALAHARDDGTAVTNVYTGRPARGLVTRLMRELGPMADDVPPFPHAAAALSALRAKAEPNGDASFQPLWAGQAAALCTADDAVDICRRIIHGALSRAAANS